jgi:putative FmdB family regulatory protein
MIYEYRCKACNTSETKLRRVAQADDKVPCTRCGRACARVVTAARFILKGTGWYKDGYK